MPQSQGSSSFYVDSYIGPGILQLDDFPDILSSQPTLLSPPTSNFTRPPQPPLAPPSLTRVGPRLQKCWVLFESDIVMEKTRDDFVEWWI
jgi:hypothetical protein